MQVLSLQPVERGESLQYCEIDWSVIHREIAGAFVYNPMILGANAITRAPGSDPVIGHIDGRRASVTSSTHFAGRAPSNGTDLTVPPNSKVQAPGSATPQAARCAHWWIVKSQIRGKWSENCTVGISNRFTSIWELCNMKSSSLRGLL